MTENQKIIAVATLAVVIIVPTIAVANGVVGKVKAKLSKRNEILVVEDQNVPLA